MLGNGLSEYDQSPTDPHNLESLAYHDAVQNEHFAAFEQRDPTTGAYQRWYHPPRARTETTHSCTNVGWYAKF